jgi:hypothetical protein
VRLIEARCAAMAAGMHYAEALEPFGGSNAVISTNSSKLLSVGALLAAYELEPISRSRMLRRTDTC